ncbi:MAG TPA: thioredoxin domain-containing protein [Chitinophagaceae bacterium]|nr:thioredoxin domain-containing protein [Chitinophagaceae bacterium]HNO00120.1 thioredoxin domain-containing protein [Chitinophagaceae bacterium]
MTTKANKLINETSPYLLQHAHNPVAWFPWGDEALQKAKAENKPILVSIGYAACHWCHVMERESFEDEATAAIMNRHFINIKIDREERPDLDHIYMDAVQAMTGSGGWPLNVFLTPDAKPFYGGTYFPPQRAFNRPSWQEVLYGIVQSFTERRNEIDAQAENLTAHLLQSNAFGKQEAEEQNIFTKENCDLIFQNIMKQADREWGGFGKAPKFPQTFSIQYLIRYAYITGNKEALQQALLSLDKMIEGGIYDQLGGGFARYATDTEWLAPHFEKMLYDNALLVSVLAEAYQFTGKIRYREVISETINFLQRELQWNGKAFLSAIDADSEGEEGKFYVWKKEEVEKILGQDAALFCTYYDISEKGNWHEGHGATTVKNILRVKKPLAAFSNEMNMAVEAVADILEKGRKKLLTARNERVRPATDDKIILGWNALMNTACSKAYAATGNNEYKKLAIDNMQFLLAAFSTTANNESLHHTWKAGRARIPAFLDDYAYLIQALIHLQEITMDNQWLQKASSFTKFVISNFSEEETPYFFYTPIDQSDVIVRKKEVYDGATPSGNSIMATNLHYLGIVFEKASWIKRSEDLLKLLSKAIIQHPNSFGACASLLLEIQTGTNEIIVIGEQSHEILPKILKNYIPHKIFQATQKADNSYPLLANKASGTEPYLYLCRNNTCFPPVFSEFELISLINKASAKE